MINYEPFDWLRATKSRWSSSSRVLFHISNERGQFRESGARAEVDTKRPDPDDQSAEGVS